MQATRLGEPAVALLRLPAPDQVLPQLEGHVRPRHVLARLWRTRPGALRLEDVFARVTPAYPVADGVQVDGLGLGGEPGGVGRHLARDAVHPAKPLVGAGRLRGSNDRAALVDPHRLRHVDHVIEIGQAMVAIDQAGVARLRGLDPRQRITLAAVQGDRDHDEAVILQLLVERLPHGQVATASSPRGPRHQQHLLATMLGERVPPPGPVGQREVRGLERTQGRRALRGARPEHPGTAIRAVDERLAQVSPERGHVDLVSAQELAFPAGGMGTHMLPRQRPSGLDDHPVAASSSPGDSHSRSPSTWVAASTVSVVSVISIAMTGTVYPTGGKRRPSSESPSDP